MCDPFATRIVYAQGILIATYIIVRLFIIVGDKLLTITNTGKYLYFYATDKYGREKAKRDRDEYERTKVDTDD